jgi:hypothetical protein
MYAKFESTRSIKETFERKKPRLKDNVKTGLEKQSLRVWDEFQ